MDLKEASETAEKAAHLVKLTMADWRRLAIVLLVVAGGTCALAFNLAAHSAKAELSRVDNKAADQDLSIKLLESRAEVVSSKMQEIAVKMVAVESAQSDIGSIKSDVKAVVEHVNKLDVAQATTQTDILWIKNYLQNQQLKETGHH